MDLEAVERLAGALKPTSIIGLLLTVVLLFGFQAETIVAQPGRVVLIAIPLLIQSYGVFAIALWPRACAQAALQRGAAPAAMIGTSNFFELAVAVAIKPSSDWPLGAAFAIVVGVLIEVPVMLSARRLREPNPSLVPCYCRLKHLGNGCGRQRRYSQLPCPNSEAEPPITSNVTSKDDPTRCVPELGETDHQAVQNGVLDSIKSGEQREVDGFNLAGPRRVGVNMHAFLRKHAQFHLPSCRNDGRVHEDSVFLGVAGLPNQRIGIRWASSCTWGRKTAVLTVRPCRHGAQPLVHGHPSTAESSPRARASWQAGATSHHLLLDALPEATTSLEAEERALADLIGLLLGSGSCLCQGLLEPDGVVLVLVDVQLEVVDLFILEAGALEACDDRRKHPRNRPLGDPVRGHRGPPGRGAGCTAPGACG